MPSLLSDQLLIEERTLQLYAEPNKGIMLNAYNHKTDIVFLFRPEEEIQYNFRDQNQMEQIVASQMEGMGWRTPGLKHALIDSSSFYFDKFCQVKMSSWTKGRIALVGDAAYCASPTAGMGGSLTMIGATALADAFEKHGPNYVLAFEEYNTALQPFINEVQTNALAMPDQLLPRINEEVQYRYTHGLSF